MNNDNLEKEIDKITRLIREFIRTGSKDVGLVGMIKNMIWKMAMTSEKDQSYLIEYALNRLLSEIGSPETVGRDRGSKFWKGLLD